MIKTASEILAGAFVIGCLTCANAAGQDGSTIDLSVPRYSTDSYATCARAQETISAPSIVSIEKACDDFAERAIADCNASIPDKADICSFIANVIAEDVVNHSNGLNVDDGLDGKLSVQRAGLLQSWGLVFTSTSDAITVRDISVNRGNCASQFEPMALKYGSQYRVALSCEPIEVIVDTDRGSEAFTWPP